MDERDEVTSEAGDVTCTASAMLLESEDRGGEWQVRMGVVQKRLRRCARC